MIDELKRQLKTLQNRIYAFTHNCVEPSGGNCCPYCGHELEYHDCILQRSERVGEIYKCPNELCESEVFNYCFYELNRDGGGLHEGYPC